MDLNNQNYSDEINDLQNDFIGESFMNSIDVFGDKGWVALLEKLNCSRRSTSTLYQLSDSVGTLLT